MTEKQERLLQLLGEFARICRENDLKYVTAEKTALGVMQRGGFLPGDDTVTVYMPAEDWHKLMNLAGTVLEANRWKVTAASAVLVRHMHLRTAVPCAGIRLWETDVQENALMCFCWTLFQRIRKNMRNIVPI